MYEQDKFRAQLSWAWKKFYNLGIWSSEKQQSQAKLACAPIEESDQPAQSDPNLK